MHQPIGLPANYGVQMIENHIHTYIHIRKIGCHLLYIYFRLQTCINRDLFCKNGKNSFLQLQLVRVIRVSGQNLPQQ